MPLPDFADHPPSADELSFGFGGQPAAPKPAAAEPAEAPAPAVRWLTDKKLTASHDLEYPFEIGGVEHRTVTIKRLSAREVASFMDAMRAKAVTSTRFPIYFVDGKPISDAAWDVLMDDDRFALEEIGSDFLPARFLLPAGTSSDQATSDTSASS